MKGRPYLDPRIQFAVFGAALMLLVLWGGLFAIDKVSGTWRNVITAERLSRSHPSEVTP